MQGDIEFQTVTIPYTQKRIPISTYNETEENKEYERIPGDCSNQIISISTIFNQ